MALTDGPSCRKRDGRAVGDVTRCAAHVLQVVRRPLPVVRGAARDARVLKYTFHIVLNTKKGISKLRNFGRPTELSYRTLSRFA